MFLFQLILTIRFIILNLFSGIGNPFSKIHVQKNKRLLILANGPSLKDFLSSVENNIDEFQNCDFSVVNDFINFDICRRLKPLHYTLSDPMFFYETKLKERGLSVMQNLSKLVTWKMYLYVNINYKGTPYLDMIKKNSNIQIVYYRGRSYNGLPQLRNFFYKHGWGNGEFSTVILNSIYVAITLGYKNIELYGVDHTFFNNLCVNENNIPCYEYSHSFGKSELEPMRFHYDDTREFKDMEYFTREMHQIFYGHKIMADYAKQMGVSIINKTKNSLIDVYTRG